MNRYRKVYRYVSITVLACFLTALTGVSAFAGHDCCGNCAESASQYPIRTNTLTVSTDCCSTKTECACTFRPESDRNQQAYSVPHIHTPDDELSAELAVAVSVEETGRNSRQDAVQAAAAEIRIRTGPIYLANQSILC